MCHFGLISHAWLRLCGEVHVMVGRLVGGQGVNGTTEPKPAINEKITKRIFDDAT